MKDMEFSGVFDIGINHKKFHNNIVYYKYFLFIKFRDLIYIDIKNVGDIIITFTELMKHPYLRMYYELSLLLIDNKHKVIESKSMESCYIYSKDSNWFIDGVQYVEDFTTKVKKIEIVKYCYYFNINPNDLKNMKVSNDTDIAGFNEVLYIRYGYEHGIIYKELFVDYTNLMIEYNIKLIEEDIEKISASHEDDKNFFNLLELNKKGMNADVFNMLYNTVISDKGRKKLNYNPYA